MGFFQELKEDLSQAVNELLPEEETGQESKKDDEDKALDDALKKPESRMKLQKKQRMQKLRMRKSRKKNRMTRLLKRSRKRSLQHRKTKNRL